MNLSQLTQWPLQSELESVSFRKLQEFVETQYAQQTVYPDAENIFRAFELTPLEEVRVVILGQDPYHQAGQAQGLAFSVPDEVKIPPSLRNIYKELNSDIGGPVPDTGNLESWAKQGVLLLNTVLTVRASEANSHRKQGWEVFTDKVIELVGHQPRPIAFVLWGKPAGKKKQLVRGEQHLVLEAPHPSPLSAYHGFFGSKPFSTINQFLVENQMAPIQWV